MDVRRNGKVAPDDGDRSPARSIWGKLDLLPLTLGLVRVEVELEVCHLQQTRFGSRASTQERTHSRDQLLASGRSQVAGTEVSRNRASSGVCASDKGSNYS